MFQIIGILVVFGMVFGGFALAGGHFDVIIKAAPFELMMIGGAGAGAFLIGNSMGGIKGGLGGFVKAMAGSKWKKQDYQDCSRWHTAAESVSRFTILSKTKQSKPSSSSCRTFRWSIIILSWQ